MKTKNYTPSLAFLIELVPIIYNSFKTDKMENSQLIWFYLICLTITIVILTLWFLRIKEVEQEKEHSENQKQAEIQQSDKQKQAEIQRAILKIFAENYNLFNHYYSDMNKRIDLLPKEWDYIQKLKEIDIQNRTLKDSI